MQHIASGRLAITLDVILLRTSHMTGGGQNRCCGANRLWRKLEDGTNGGWDEWRMGRMAGGTYGGLVTLSGLAAHKALVSHPDAPAIPSSRSYQHFDEPFLSC
jgi:hypothetical protein